MASRRRSFGSLRTLPSGHIQARYTGPDGLSHYAPITFTTKTDAETYLATVRADLVRGLWQSTDSAKPLTFGAYTETWLADRTLKPRTHELYRSLLDRRILPTFAGVVVTAITPAAVRRWYADQPAATPTARAHAYGLLKAICATAVADEHIAANPCRISGGGTARRVHRIRPATLPELEALVAAMPARYRLMVLLASWCALRFGELAELRRGDIDVRSGVLRVRRAVVRVDGRAEVGTPKSDAGIRDVAIPPHLIPLVREHLRTQITGGRDGLLFPAADGTSHLAPSTLYKSFRRARQATGRPDLRFHDLRHTGAVLAAATGASLAELMGRLGHSTPSAALRYQHAAEGRDKAIAEALSALAGGGCAVIPARRGAYRRKRWHGEQSAARLGITPSEPRSIAIWCEEESHDATYIGSLHSYNAGAASEGWRPEGPHVTTQRLTLDRYESVEPETLFLLGLGAHRHRFLCPECGLDALAGDRLGHAPGLRAVRERDDLGGIAGKVLNASAKTDVALSALADTGVSRLPLSTLGLILSI